jgi:TPR repeat protein
MSRHYAKLFIALLAASFIAMAGGAFAASYDDAMTAYDNGDYATALKLLRPLAERGDTNAQYSIGRMYAKGEGVPKDEAEAVNWFRKANEQGKALKAYNSGDFAFALKTFRPLAEKGQVMAAYILGLMYANGQGVSENYPEALKWLQKAAEQGEAKAQFSVGVIYAKGLGVPQNYADAFKWYRRSADQGYAIAQFNLGAMYAKGEAVAADPITAHMLYTLAAQHGVKAAGAAKDSLAKSMTAAQIAEADKKAHDWKPKFELE